MDPDDKRPERPSPTERVRADQRALVIESLLRCPDRGRGKTQRKAP
jgi:hypothetical protein